MNAWAQEGLLRTIHASLRRPLPPESRGWIQLVVIIVVLLFLQGASGVLLSVYYLPSPDSAAESVRFIMRDVQWGWLVRGFHAWGSSAILILLVASLARTLVLGAYRGARAGSWVIGVVVLLLVVALAFTGELLVWDERSMGLAVAALDGTAAVPIVGPLLADLMRGGAEIGVATLARAHAAHALILPWLAFLVLLLDLWARSRPGNVVPGELPAVEAQLPLLESQAGGER